MNDAPALSCTGAGVDSCAGTLSVTMRSTPSLGAIGDAKEANDGALVAVCSRSAAIRLTLPGGVPEEDRGDDMMPSGADVPSIVIAIASESVVWYR